MLDNSHKVIIQVVVSQFRIQILSMINSVSSCNACHDNCKISWFRNAKDVVILCELKNQIVCVFLTHFILLISCLFRDNVM